MAYWGEVIGLTDEQGHERKWEIDGQFVYHERLLTAIGVCFKAEVLLSSIDEDFTATWEILGDEQPPWSPDGLLRKFRWRLIKDGGDWNFEDMQAGLSAWREQCDVVLENSRSLVECVGFLVPYSGLNRLCLL